MNEGESNRKQKKGSTNPLDDAFSVALDEMFAMETIHPNETGPYGWLNSEQDSLFDSEQKKNHLMVAKQRTE